VAPPTPADTTAAWQLLKSFTLQEFKGLARPLIATADQRSKLRQALLTAYSQPYIPDGWNPAISKTPDVLLGIMASDSRLAVRALRDWCQALGLPYAVPDSRVAGVDSIAAVQGSVYIKYNSTTQQSYLTLYQGRDRGVLVQLGQAQLGHFPLGFFDEQMSSPPPAM